MLSISDLYYSYGNKNVLKNISFALNKSELCFLLGSNGAGKSTLIKCILHLLNYKKGNIFINDINLKNLSLRERSKLVSYVPQEHSASFNQLVIDVVIMGAANQLDFYQSPSEKERIKAKNILENLKISHLMHRGYAEISGGERQLVLIARALMQDSNILIMDEPYSNLDYGNQIRLMKILLDLKKMGYIVLLSSHNPQDAFLYADKVIVMNDGEIKNIGKPDIVLTPDLLSEIYKCNIEIIKIKKKYTLCVPKKEEN